MCCYWWPHIAAVKAFVVAINLIFTTLTHIFIVTISHTDTDGLDHLKICFTHIGLLNLQPL